MKNFKRVVVWAMLSIMLQTMVLLYCDKVLFRQTSDIVFIEDEEKKEEVVVEVEMPSDAENIKLSPDGKYVVYLSNGDTHMVNTKTGEKLTGFKDDETIDLLCYDWQVDKNILLLAETKVSDSGRTVINLATYNPKSDTKRNAYELCSYEEGMTVEHIVNSTKSSVTYVPVSRDGYSATIYRIDINEDMTKLYNRVPALGHIEAFYAKDALIYEDTVNDIYYKYSNNELTPISFENPANTIILGLTNNGVIYAGIKNIDGKVSEIIYGEDEISPSQWEHISLEEPKELSDIYVTIGINQGEVLINDNLKGKITNLSTNDEITYEGKFITMNDEVICSLSNSILKIKSLTSIDK